MEEKTYYFSMARFFMELTTIWYPKNMTETSRKVYKMLAYFLKGNFYLFVSLLVIGLITTDSQEDRDLYLQYSLTLMGTSVRILFLQTKKITAIYSGIYHVEKIIASEENKKLRNIFFDDVKYNKKVTKLFIVLIGLTIFLYILLSLYLWFKLKDVFFSVLWYPFDKDEHINFVAMHQIFCSAYCLTAYQGLNITIVPLILFATTRLKLLCYKFKHFKQIAENIDLSPKDYLKLLVEEHQDIISYVDSINHSLRWSFIVDFMLKSYTFTQCLFGVLIEFNEDHIRSSINLSTLILVAVEIWYASFHGNELILASQELSNCIFANNWYELDIGIQKDLQMIMLRSQIPLRIVVGNLFYIDNNLFLAIMKAGYTFLLYYHV